ncbi:MAG: diacylglycerol/lipid kinase family protein [Omnitrophica WOR_2 bacterium]|jgi:YegS/Rv2252/BmrU family lipid kinase
MKSSGNDWFVIVNPNAGRRRGEKDWLEIARLITEAGLDFTSVFTDAPNHAVKLARKYIEAGFRKIIVVGGDGTLNEVINGIFSQHKYAPDEIIIAMIPVGTGNDWGRSFNIPEGYKEAVDIIAKGKTFRQDVGKVVYTTASNQKTRYFINMAGMGFDAMVAKKTNKQKQLGKGGPLSYLVNLFTSLIAFKPVITRLLIDGKPVDEDIFSMSIAICQFNGGGMKQAPQAIPDDGLFDITIITRVTRMTVIRNVAKLYDGSFVKLRQVKQFRGQIVKIESDPELYLETDGESLGHTPMTFEIMPRCVTVITGN